MYLNIGMNHGFIINGECDFTNCGDRKQQKQCLVETRKTQTPWNFQTGVENRAEERTLW